MTKRFLEGKEIHDLARNVQGKFFFADDKEKEEIEEDTDIDKGGKTQA